MVPKSDMNTRNQMNGLYPIIRRVRRPLLPVDPPADAKPDPGLVKDATTKEQGGDTPKQNDDQVASIEKDN
jgi:hypothetical protein